MTCPCGEPTPDTATIGPACRERYERDLGDIPALVAELDLTLSRQTASGERVGGRSSEKPMPYDVGASEALGRLRVTLVGWVQVLHDPTVRVTYTEGPVCDGVDPDGEQDCQHASCGGVLWPLKQWESWPADTLDSMSRWLLARSNRATHHEAGGEIVEEVHDAVRNIERTLHGAKYRSRIVVGPCFMQHDAFGVCPGTIRALIPWDETRPSLMRCDACTSEWAVSQWLEIGEFMGRAS